MRTVKRWAIRLVWAVLLVLATLVIGGAVDARRRHPDLKPWHELIPDDVDAGELGGTTSRSSSGSVARTRFLRKSTGWNTTS